MLGVELADVISMASAARERGCGDRESELTGVFGRLMPSGG
jgi:hypothetical protein